MQITVNGETRDVNDAATVADLVAVLNIAPERVAVEVNEQLVRRVNHPATQLHAGDRVEIVTLVGGG
jgi:thiamine biosynthesis protein ThiS